MDVLLLQTQVLSPAGAVPIICVLEPFIKSAAVSQALRWGRENPPKLYETHHKNSPYKISKDQFISIHHFFLS